MRRIPWNYGKKTPPETLKKISKGVRKSSAHKKLRRLKEKQGVQG